MLQPFYDFLGLEVIPDPVQIIVVAVSCAIVASVCYGVIQMIFDLIVSLIGRKK